MTEPRRVRAQDLLKQVDAILWTHWNPISCGVPEDEYTAYAPPIVRLLIEDADTVAIAAYLSRAREEAMGLSPDEHADYAVAVRLKALIIIE